MTKKDYIAIAKAIKDARMPSEQGVRSYTDNVNETCSVIAYNIANVLQSDNPSFDRNRFLIACGVTIG